MRKGHRGRRNIKDSNKDIFEDIDDIYTAISNDKLFITPFRKTSFEKFYKAQLRQSSGELDNIVVRRCKQIHTANNEVNMLKDLKHKNIAPTLKYFDMHNDTLVIVNKYEANESLDKHLSSSSTLGWMQRLHICVGVADALCYLHFDAEADRSVIHGNIKSSKILLDHHWEPKLHGFAFAIRPKKNQLYPTDIYNGSLLYMDPAYETTGGLTTKSDVFSFGVVLFEVLFGRDASSTSNTPDNNNDKLYFARLARVHYEEKTLDDMIHPDLREQMNSEGLNIFSETAYFCLKEQRSERPDMRKVLRRLKGALQFQRKHESREHSTAGEGGRLTNHLKVKSLDHLRISLKDIKLATQNFSEKYLIGSGGFGMVYKAKLEHFGGESSPTVAIKRIFGKVDGQAEKGFLAEIELLSKCRHPNIVCLIGFCNEETEMILIYEYATNGSLEAYLGNNDNLTNLSWAKRIKISIGIAYGLHYLHTVTKDKECIIHRDIKSANILLDDKWEAKIADFGLSKLHPTYNQRSTLVTGNIGGTQVYMDPEYEKTGNLKISSDVYSFGVVLCEIMSGNLAYDNIYNTMGLPSIVQQRFKDRTIEKMVDPQMKESDENTFVLNDGLNLDSVYTFSKITSQCVAEAQTDRPRMKTVLKELEKSLNLQIHRKDNLQISLEDIKLGTQNFSDHNCTGRGRFWRLYEGRTTPILAKRFDSRLDDEGNSQFKRELKFLYEHKHKNIVGLVGYCNEMGEKIIVYEHDASANGTLDKHLDNAADLTWTKRLKIGLDVARALDFLHTGGTTKDFRPMIHRDIKSSSILLDGDWRAKLCNLEESSYATERKKAEHIDDGNEYGSLSYLDEEYKFRSYLHEKSDIYSLGVVLVEMLLGRLACAKEFVEGSSNKSLVDLAKWLYQIDTVDLGGDDNDVNEKRILEGIEEQIVPRSLDAYLDITFKCLEYNGDDRPDASELVEQFTLALAYQEDYEIWEPKLPKDYDKLCEMSKDKFEFRGKEIFDRSSNEPERIKNFYDLLCKGFLFQEGKAWFSLGSKGKRNVRISARLFAYTDHWVRKWQPTADSRFQVVAKMLDTSNLKVKINIKPQLLLPGDNYGVHLVFKFCNPGKCLAKQMYVNLKYKRGSESLHSDFATWSEDGWLTIELCQILNYVEDTKFEVLLDSFSRSYCGSSVYIEGIEFRTIETGYEQDGSKEIEKYQETQKYEEIKKLKEVQHSPVDSMEILKSRGNANEGFSQKEIQSEKICFMLSEMEAPSKSSKAKPFQLKYSAESRFQGEIELSKESKRQVFGIKGKIESQVLSPDTDYTCYLVFKLSETCHGLHCPVRVRNVLQWKNKEVGLICFRSSSPWNSPNTNGAPKQRDDGWMEVLVWKFNSKSALRSNHIPMYLKFITYEGTMSGLIVSGLEVRPM